MLIPFLFLAFPADAGEVRAFPEKPHAEVRRAVREVLTHRRRWGDAEVGIALRTGPAAAARIALEEVNADLSTARRAVPRPRVESTLNALLELPAVAAVGPERGALRAALRPLLRRSTVNGRLEPALGLAVHFKVWEPDDVREIDLTHARRAFLHRWYFLIAASAGRLNSAGLDEVARQLLANDSDPLVRFALLEEIDRLPPALDAMVLRLLRFEFTPVGDRAANPGARRIHLRVLARWQDRIRAGETRARAALALLEAEPTDRPGRAFARGLAGGRLPTELSGARLSARDPLGLGCAARLVDHSYK